MWGTLYAFHVAVSVKEGSTNIIMAFPFLPDCIGCQALSWLVGWLVQSLLGQKHEVAAKTQLVLLLTLAASSSPHLAHLAAGSRKKKKHPV